MTSNRPLLAALSAYLTASASLVSAAAYQEARDREPTGPKAANGAPYFELVLRDNGAEYRAA
ncbi:hypothetical protein [Mangrovicoccus sp. HB161399]|uniref:hypothetical protein n=1 Tax=Mangrovicoccus sp. HB161399 TaxID=2720392 RepID=UPI001552D4CB|nr:hypothetical protein [Mangrovicoccus sp. HB161399]